MSIYLPHNPARVMVKIRIQHENPATLEKIRKRLLKANPDMIMGKPRKGSNPKYEGQQKYACYGDIKIGVKRNRREKL